MVSSLVKFHMSLTNPVPELSLSFNPFIGRGSESSRTELHMSLTNPVPELSLSFKPSIGRGSESSRIELDITKYLSTAGVSIRT